MSEQTPRNCPNCGHLILYPIISEFCTNCGKKTGLKVNENETSQMSTVDTIFFGVTFFVYLIVPFALIDITDAIFKFYPNIPSLMLYSVVLYAAVVFPIAYLWKWIDRHVKTSRKKKEALRKEN